MPSIRQKNDLTDEVQLVCHGLDPGVQAAHERSCAVESVRGITQAAMNCRWGELRRAAICRRYVNGSGVGDLRGARAPVPSDGIAGFGSALAG
jgi:hypothetical protein